MEFSQCFRVIAAAIIQILDSLDLKYPEVGPDKLKELAATRAALVVSTTLVVACL